MKIRNFLSWLFGKRYINISKTKQLEKRGITPLFNFKNKLEVPVK